MGAFTNTWSNSLGSQGTLLNQLPLRLYINPALYYEEMDSLTGWSFPTTFGDTGLNTSEKNTGAASIKLACSDGVGYRYVEKDITINLLGKGKNIKIAIYPHSDPATTIDTLQIMFCQDTTLNNFFYVDIPKAQLTQNQWNIIENVVSLVGAGSPTWDNISHVKIRMKSVAGQFATCSFDTFSIGNTKRKAVLILFDDCAASFYTKALPLFYSRNQVATTYCISSLIDSAGYMTSQQLIDAYAKKIDVGNHTHNHYNLTTLTAEQVTTEIETCRAFLDNLGLTKASKHVAYPLNAYNATVQGALSAWGALTGRTDSVISNHYESISRYAIRAKTVSNTDSAETVKGWIDAALVENAIPTILLHDIVDANANTAIKWLTSQLTDVLDHVKTNNIQTLTISEFWKLNTEQIIVSHK